MKANDMAALSNAAQVLNSVAKFEVTEIGSITVQANVLRSDPGNGRDTGSVAIRVFPDDPKFAQLEAMLRDNAASTKAQATAALAAANIAVEIDQAEIDAVRVDTAAAKAQLEDLKARNAAKAAMLAAQDALKNGQDPQAAATEAAKKANR